MADALSILAESHLSRAIGLAESIEHDTNSANGTRAVASEIATLIRASKDLPQAVCPTPSSCASCGHEERLHKMTNGYKPYGSCNFQHDLCGCREFRPAGEMPEPELAIYRDGFADGLRWVLARFNLDAEDEDALNEALESGPWE